MRTCKKVVAIMVIVTMFLTGCGFNREESNTADLERRATPVAPFEVKDEVKIQGNGVAIVDESYKKEMDVYKNPKLYMSEPIRAKAKMAECSAARAEFYNWQFAVQHIERYGVKMSAATAGITATANFIYYGLKYYHYLRGRINWDYFPNFPFFTAGVGFVVVLATIGLVVIDGYQVMVDPDTGMVVRSRLRFDSSLDKVVACQVYENADAEIKEADQKTKAQAEKEV
ncbi:MAG: hypothetical protein LE168_03285 [Endomicrobium sp.]|nr:hypothetical protein [Endomicrobium sp.]